ncbi:MAG: hypothetical protein AB7F89_02510 [Pirellulaceae bacterium]
MNRVFSAVMACLLVTVSYVEVARAQGDVLAELYGQGVHAYFAGHVFQAHDLLTSAIDQGSNDPRCYYFRGLCYLRTGRPYEAEMDFKIGAELELNNEERVFPVADSLQRVQGPARMQIERERQLARLAARARGLAQPSTYQEKAAGPGSRPSQPPAGSRPAGGDPFAEGSEPPVKAPPRAKPAIAAPPAAEDPFGAAPDASAPAAPPAAPSTDPFGAPSAPPAAPSADPFGAPAAPPAAADPFGTPASGKDTETNPFGDDKPAGKPAAEAADPFGD